MSLQPRKGEKSSDTQQISMFDLDSCCGKTFPEPSPAAPQKARTSASSWKRSSALKFVMFQSLDLTPGAGNLLGESYWELISPWRGDALTLNTGVSPREEKESSLSQILQVNPPSKYYLTRKACLGILRRAFERGKGLPKKLQEALEIQSGIASLGSIAFRPENHPTSQPNDSSSFRGVPDIPVQPIAFATNQRDEVRDLHDVAGALGAQPGMKQQTFIAGFSAGAGASAGGIGYGEELAPTLKGSAGGNCTPSVLCLNDQGGSVMECSTDVTGTLRAQEHGHQPLVYENHGIDSRYTGPHPVSPTLSARCGTGGNNVPLVEQMPVHYSPGNGTGYHAVFSRQRADVFHENHVVSTESARQHKDATDLVVQPHQKTVGTLGYSDHKGVNNQYVSDGKCVVEGVNLIRRLTPLECERLQGFPDGWTAIPGASDSARYKALGNSVAIPCVDYVLYGISLVLLAS